MLIQPIKKLSDKSKDKITRTRGIMVGFEGTGTTCPEATEIIEISEIGRGKGMDGIGEIKENILDRE